MNLFEQWRHQHNILCLLAQRKFGKPVSWYDYNIKEFRFYCLLCNHKVEGLTAEDLIQHGMTHIKEHNLLLFI